MDQARFERTMHEFNIYQIDDLNYVDEYPSKTEWLQKFEPSSLEPEELLKKFDEAFICEE
jgi:hypothetical protein